MIAALPRLDFGSRRRGFGIAALAVIGAFLVVTYFAVASGLSPARTYLYGGPIAIGVCHNDYVFLTSNTCASDVEAWARYVADIAIVAVFLLVTGGVGGTAALAVATAGALLGVRLSLRDTNGAVHILPSWLIIFAVAIAASYLGPWIAGYLGRIRRPPTERRPPPEPR